MCSQDLCEQIKCISENSEKFGIFRKIFQLITIISSVVLIVYLFRQFFEAIIPAFEYYQQYEVRKCNEEQCYYFSNQELSEQQISNENCDKQNDPEEYSQDRQYSQKIIAYVLFGISLASFHIQTIMVGFKFFTNYKCESKIFEFFFVFGDYCSMFITYFGFYISNYDPNDKCIKKANFNSLQFQGVLQFQRTVGMLFVYYSLTIIAHLINCCCECCKWFIYNQTKIVCLNILIISGLVEISIITKDYSELNTIESSQWIQLLDLILNCLFQIIEGIIEFTKENNNSKSYRIANAY